MVVKPSEKEQQYFIEKEMKRLKKIREEHLKSMAESERNAMRDLHYLHCAKCGQTMQPTTLSGGEIEVCPDCGGIYLDRGELAKIVDESNWKPFSKSLAFARKMWNAS